ncbi:MAG: hypothetical protein RIG61_11540 [Deltaproteobacteria bacterium]
MDRKKFLIYLEAYGAELDKWPAELREKAKEVCSLQPDLLKALNEERRFEEALSMRRFEEASPGLERRIIDTAAMEKPALENYSMFDILGSVFKTIPLPRPAIALPLLLVLGIFAGFLYASYTENAESSTQLAGLLYYEEIYYE